MKKALKNTGLAAGYILVTSIGVLAILEFYILINNLITEILK